MSGVSHSTLDDFINRNALGVDVLSGLCTVPECEIGELLEFIPPEK
ncbi:helix-turn-helix transcriptional regulator [Oscillibacter sp.]|jgi:DNA-binding Xre family transcriptional regulator|nr:helix-turn-helix transcriptional regulator [Oscillibacter sp.]